jgi:hypothetical protein
MKRILKLASLAEGGFGLVLVAVPQVVAQILFATDLSGMALTLGRLTGLCLIALAISCWPGSDSRNAYYGMLTWSVAAMVYLIVVGRSGPAGFLLWPAVVAHAAIAALLLLTKE